MKDNKLTMANLLREIKDFFSKHAEKDEDYLKFNDHSLATIENLLDERAAAPWDEEEGEDE